MIGAGNENVAECHTCAHEEMHNGIPDFDILPDQTNCKEEPTEITKVKCPSWARHACFVGDGVQKVRDYKVSKKNLIFYLLTPHELILKMSRNKIKNIGR